jgi:diguanylate cyclase (GGDEF)-like protein
VLIKWSERSLSFWVGLSIVLTVLPLVIAACAIHVLSQSVAADYDDLSLRYRDQVVPLRQLEVSLWESATHVDNFVETREPRSLEALTAARERIRVDLRQLGASFGSASSEARAIDEVGSAWGRAEACLPRIVAVGIEPAVADIDRFEHEIASAQAVLARVEKAVSGDVAADHVAAVRGYRRSNWVNLLSVLVAAGGTLFGVGLISRVMLANTTRLVDGARKFADGEREHVIDIRVPVELRVVAHEFNRMIGRIRETEARLAEEARRDPLTGLANRRAFDEALDAAFARLRRLREPFVLLSLDVDRFKSINDSHGHAGGDEVLCTIARGLVQSIREVDGVFRVGGEEFAVLVAATDLAGAQVAAERLRQTVAASPVPIGDQLVDVTVSIGLVPASMEASAADLCRAADDALYRAKTSGRNRVVTAIEASDCGVVPLS